MGSMISPLSQPGFRSTSRGSAMKTVLPRSPRATALRLQNPKPVAPKRSSLNEEIDQSNLTHIANLNRLLEKTAAPPSQLLNDTHKPDSSVKLSNKNGIRLRSVLKALDLTGIWPTLKTSGDDKSPRYLNNLQMLLSRSSEHSPRNNLGDRWPEYHGSGDWAGLLDPLDDNLRREIIRYGEFVQAAYRSFNFDPATTANAEPTRGQVDLPDKYRVTKSLYATSSVSMPDWVDELMPDLGWMTQRSSKIGYVAVCDDEREIARMGRRDIVIALRGTSTYLEWAENVRATLVQIPGNDGSGNSRPMVECGFRSLYKTRVAHIKSLSEAIVEEVRRLMGLYKGETLSITVTGHSLGAALAILAADELSMCAPNMPRIAVFSFGGPRVGNRAFADRISDNGVKVLRIVNAQDIITKVPGLLVSDKRPSSDNLNGVGVLGNMPWAYSHVGSELRIDSKTSPFLKPNADMACCHDLEAYLHLVDGFKGSDCPFRPNAKRSLVGLLHQQGANVKKLYTNRALTLNLERVGSAIPSCLPSPS